MQIYHYSALNGEYTGAGFADPDPLDTGNWLFPASSTTQKPPAVALPNTVACYRAGAWTIIPDFRGTQYWVDGVGFTIEDIDEIVPDGADTVEPPKSPSVLTNSDVNKERDRRIIAGTTVVVGSDVFAPDGTLLQAAKHIVVGGDDTTKVNLLGLAQAATLRVSNGDVSTITKYRDETNTVYDLTPPEILQVWSEGATYVSEVFAHSWALKDDPSGIPTDYTDDGHWP